MATCSEHCRAPRLQGWGGRQLVLTGPFPGFPIPSIWGWPTLGQGPGLGLAPVQLASSPCACVLSQRGDFVQLASLRESVHRPPSSCLVLC